MRPGRRPLGKGSGHSHQRIPRGSAAANAREFGGGENRIAPHKCTPSFRDRRRRDPESTDQRIACLAMDSGFARRRAPRNDGSVLISLRTTPGDAAPRNDGGGYFRRHPPKTRKPASPELLADAGSRTRGTDVPEGLEERRAGQVPCSVCSVGLLKFSPALPALLRCTPT